MHVYIGKIHISMERSRIPQYEQGIWKDGANVEEGVKNLEKIRV